MYNNIFSVCKVLIKKLVKKRGQITNVFSATTAKINEERESNSFGLFYATLSIQLILYRIITYFNKTFTLMKTRFIRLRNFNTFEKLPGILQHVIINHGEYIMK